MPVEELLRQRAVNVMVVGSYTLPRWFDPQGKPRTFACRTTRVSPYRMMVEAPVIGRVGDRLSSYFREFGQFEGSISGTQQRGFLLELEMTHAVREKFAEKLTWLEKKQKDPTVKDGRSNARFIPKTPHTILTLHDGSVQSCFVIDVSLSGVAVSAAAQPPIGMPLAVGACIGRVVRMLPHGFAVKFIEKQNPIDLMRLLIRTPPRQIPAAPAGPE